MPFIPRLPSFAEFRSIDRETAYKSRCKRCDHTPQGYDYIKTQYEYRGYTVCPKCGFREEF